MTRLYVEISDLRNIIVSGNREKREHNQHRDLCGLVVCLHHREWVAKNSTIKLRVNNVFMPPKFTKFPHGFIPHGLFFFFSFQTWVGLYFDN